MAPRAKYGSIIVLRSYNWVSGLPPGVVMQPLPNVCDLLTRLRLHRHIWVNNHGIMQSSVAMYVQPQTGKAQI